MTNTVLLMPYQAADKIGVAVTTLAHWRHQHRGPPYVRFGRVVRYRLAAVDAWILEQEIEPSAGLPGPDDDAGGFPDLDADVVNLDDFATGGR